MKTQMLHKFVTESGREILIPATFNLNAATTYAKKEDSTATYVGIEIKW